MRQTPVIAIHLVRDTWGCVPSVSIQEQLVVQASRLPKQPGRPHPKNTKRYLIRFRQSVTSVEDLGSLYPVQDSRCPPCAGGRDRY